MPTFNLSTENPSKTLTAVAKQFPEKVAITDYVDGNERFKTYSEVEESVNLLASYFTEMGVQVDDRVAIVSQNRLEIVEVFLAAMRVGATPFSINPNFSPENMEYVFKDASPTFSFIESCSKSHLLSVVKEHTSLATVCFEEGLEEVISYREIFKRKVFSFDDYDGMPKGIIYTSGSTGFPKGVLRKLERADPEFPIRMAGITLCENNYAFQNTKTIVHIPMFHIAGIGAIWSSFVGGSPLVIMRYFDPRTYLKLVSRYKLKSIGFLPNLLSMCLKENDLVDTLDFDLKLIMVFGGSCSQDTLSKAQDAFGCPVLSVYGMTEGGPNITMEGFNLDDLPLGSCGKAEEDAELKLVDFDGNESDLGELWFRNEYLFEAYYNRTDLMDAKFQDGWFKSGDVFYRDKNGFFFHRGRTDDMFVCDGENIYPSEIESILEKHDDALQSCVVSSDDSEHGQIPLAMVFCRAGSKVNEEQLRQYYLKNGPMYAYPRIISIVDKIPSLGPGKVNRPEIKKILSEKLAIKKLLENNTEMYSCFNDQNILGVVVGLWKSILKLDDMNKDDDVFDLGVNSIQATLFAEKVKILFQVPFAIQDVFELVTPSQISDHITIMIKTKQLTHISSALLTDSEII